MKDIQIFFSIFLHENICCRFSLETPHLGTSNEYHKIYFRGEIRKISYFLALYKHFVRSSRDSKYILII